MIAIVSSSARERVAFAAVCESRGWPWTECDSVRKLARLLIQMRPRVIILRHKLADGYSDDVLRMLKDAGSGQPPKVIVLLSAGTPSAVEARQVLLGADVVLCDPIRADVVSAYVERFRATRPRLAVESFPADRGTISFAGASVNVVERTLRHGTRNIGLTPREVELIQILSESRGQVVTYEALYSEILGRKFQGDTSNMRVLLGKLGDTCRRVGLTLRSHVDVIPKSGYRLRPAPAQDPTAGAP
jgi:DNA-binding response OmpR family regulator